MNIYVHLYTCFCFKNKNKKKEEVGNNSLNFPSYMHSNLNNTGEIFHVVSLSQKIGSQTKIKADKNIFNHVYFIDV